MRARLRARRGRDERVPMEWRDEGLVIGARKHGETSVILEILTPGRGRHVGVVPGGRSRRMRALLQPGNGLMVTWRARLDEHIGTFTVEPSRMRAGRIMESALALHALNHLCALVRLLPERDPHPDVHERVAAMLDFLADPQALPRLMVQFELSLLANLGFGLDLGSCAATGDKTDLAFVSPRTGRAVGRTAGEPYRDRILVLPEFLRTEFNGTDDHVISPEDLLAGFRLTQHFLERDIFAPRGLTLPDARQAYLTALFRAGA